MRAAAKAGVGFATGGAALLYVLSLPSAFTLPKLAALAAGLALAGAALAADPKAPDRPRALDLPLAACAAALALSLAFSIDPSLSLAGRYNTWSHGVWTCALYAALLWAAAAAFRGAEVRALRWLAALSAVIALDALAQKAGLDPWISRDILPQGRAVATLGSPIDLGGALALLSPLTIEAAASTGPLGWIAAALTAGALWATASRGAWLGAVCGALTLVALDGLPWLGRRLPKGARAAAAGLALAALICAPLASVVRPRVDAARVAVWKTAWRVFELRPLAGFGPDTFEAIFRRYRGEDFVQAMHTSTSQQAYAHNDVLQALATMGVLGAAAYLWLLAALVLAARRALKGPSRAAAASAAAGLAALFVNLKFNPVSLEVLALAAALAGILSSLGEPSGRKGSRLLYGAVAALGVVSLAAVGRLWRADRLHQQAREDAKAGRWEQSIDKHRAALALTPCELAFGIDYVNDLGGALNATHDVPARLKLLAYGTEEGKTAVRCRPSSVDAHYIAGVAELYYVQLASTDHLPLAQRELDEALEFDPMFWPLLSARLQAARLAGDAVKAAEIQARIDHLAIFGR